MSKELFKDVKINLMVNNPPTKRKTFQTKTTMFGFCNKISIFFSLKSISDDFTKVISNSYIKEVIIYMYTVHIIEITHCVVDSANQATQKQYLR